MAENLLTKLLKQELTSKSLIYWLNNQTIDDQTDNVKDFISKFDSVKFNKNEFVPFFLNFLRDEASAVLYDSKTSFCSPLKPFAPVIAQKSASSSSVPHFNSSSSKSCKSSLHNFDPLLYETPSNRKWPLQDTSFDSPETESAISFSGRRDFHGQRSSIRDSVSPADGSKWGRKTRNDDISQLVGGRRNSTRGSRIFNSGSKIRTSIGEQVESPPAFDLASSDDFPDVTRLKETRTPNHKEETRSRRIVPTPVSCLGPSVDQTSSFTKVTNVPAPAKVMPRSIWAKPPENITDLVNPSGNEELSELVKRLQGMGKETNSRSSTRRDKGNNSEIRITKADSVETKILPGSLSAAQETKVAVASPPAVNIQAAPSDVTEMEKLEILAEFYAQCILEGLVSNVSMELYFLMQLLTVRGALSAKQEAVSEAGYLSTVHNAVFFATTALLQLKSFLFLLDRPTVRLMAENFHISCFSPKLKEILTGILEQPVLQIHSSCITLPLGGVMFQPETDNRKNFPSDLSFHSFKKQRDVFYELLREWEQKHLSPGWTMKEKQLQSIRWLMDECRTDLTNYVHLVRLFVLQLIKMCSEEGTFKSEEREAQLQLQLLEANHDKLKRLQERLTNPASTGGIAPPPSFPGCQEFFRDFIAIASDHAFCRQLTDVLVAKINKLTESSETSNFAEFSDRNSVQEKHEELLRRLLTLRILGKFLGFITFLPYRSIEVPQDSVKILVIDTRDQSSQLVDVLSHMRTSQQLEQILVNVVWIVDFLSQMDFIAPDLRYFREVCSLLVDIYWGCCQLMNKHCSHDLFLIVALLGWLFELKLFPEELFYHKKPRRIFSDDIFQRYRNSQGSFLIVDQKILYSCCPFLVELRSLLLDFTTDAGQSATVSVRKITPIKSIDCAPTFAKRDIQKQLEDSFFSLHSSSLLQTVAFTANRVASNFVKMFQSTVLSENLEHCQSKAKEEAQCLVSSSVVDDSKIQSEAKLRIEEFVQSVVWNVVENGTKLSKGYCMEKVESLMGNLLPEEMVSAMRTIVIEKCVGRCIGKVGAWLRENVTFDILLREANQTFSRELLRQPSSISANGLPQIKRLWSTEHLALKHSSTATPSPSDLLIDLRQLLHGLLFTKCSVEVSRIQDAVASISAVILDRKDLLPNVLIHILMLSVNLALFSVFFRPDLWTQSIEDCVVQIWETQSCGQSLEMITSNKFIYCFRNSSQESQKKFIDLVKLLLQKSLLKAETSRFLNDLSQKLDESVR